MAPPTVCDPCACAPSEMLAFANNEHTFRTALLTILCQLQNSITAWVEPGVVLIYKENNPIVAYRAAEDTDVARGDALLAAVAAHEANDIIRISGGTYDIGSSNITLLSGVGLIGSGINVTTIKSSVLLATGPMVIPADNTYVADLYLQQDVNLGDYQACYGISTNLSAQNAKVYNVKMTGGTDGLYVLAYPDTNIDITLVDCVLSTLWDAVAIFNNDSAQPPTTLTINIVDSEIYTAGGHPLNAGFSRGAYYEAGVNYLINTKIEATNQEVAGSASCITSESPDEKGLSIYAYNMVLTASAASTPLCIKCGGGGSGDAVISVLNSTYNNTQVTIDDQYIKYLGRFPQQVGSSGTVRPVTTVLADFYTDAGNSTTSETDIYNINLPALTFGANGDRIVAFYSISCVGHATATKQLKWKFNNVTILDTGALALTTNQIWVVRVEMVRTGAATARVTVSASTLGAATTVFNVESDLAGLTFTTSYSAKMTFQAAGVGAASNQMVAKHGSIEFKPTTGV